MKLKNFKLGFNDNGILNTINEIVLEDGDDIYIEDNGIIYIITGQGNVGKYFQDGRFTWLNINNINIDYSQAELIAIKFNKSSSYSYRTCYSAGRDVIYYNKENNVFKFDPNGEDNSCCGYRNKQIEVPEEFKTLGFNIGFESTHWCDSSD